MEQLRDTTKNRFSDIVRALKVSELKDVPCFFSQGDKWCAGEELTLLAALQTYGYGNWNVIAATLSKVCKKDFTPREVQMHYNDVYLEGEIGKTIRKCGIPPLKSSLIDHTEGEDGKLLRSSDMNAHLHVPKRFLEKIGYMPLREDFVMESNPGAEAILKRVRFKDNMENFDKTVNLLIVDTYRNKIKERIMKKKTIKSLRMIERFYTAHKEGKSKKSVKSKAKSCSPPLSPALIATLFPDDVKDEFYESLFADNKSPVKSEKQFVATKKKEKDSAEVNDLNHSVRKSPRFQGKAEKCATPAVSVKGRLLRSGRTVGEDNEDTCSDSSSSNDSSESDSEDSIFTIKTLQPSKNSSSHEVAGPNAIYCFPWVEYLAENERNLCLELKLRPMYYIYYKAFLMREDLRRRQGKKFNSNLVPEGMTALECMSIYNFIKGTGWIKSAFAEFWD